MNGLFITFDGPDGTGKSTQIEMLRKRCQEQGIDCVFIREPGGTEIGEQIRKILLDPENIGMCRKTEALLYAASRAQLVEKKIRPALEEGLIVICDRFADSSIAYQAYGFGEDPEPIRLINEFARSDVYPTRTYLLHCSLEKSLSRISNRGREDRIEGRQPDYHHNVLNGFLQIARNEPERVMLINTEEPAEQVHEKIWADFSKLLLYWKGSYGWKNSSSKYPPYRKSEILIE